MISLSKIKKLLHSFLYPIIIGVFVFLMTKLELGVLSLGIILFAGFIADFNGLYNIEKE